MDYGARCDDRLQNDGKMPKGMRQKNSNVNITIRLSKTTWRHFIRMLFFCCSLCNRSIFYQKRLNTVGKQRETYEYSSLLPSYVQFKSQHCTVFSFLSISHFVPRIESNYIFLMVLLLLLVTLLQVTEPKSFGSANGQSKRIT